MSLPRVTIQSDSLSLKKYQYHCKTSHHFASSTEINKGRLEVRTLRSSTASAETICFPFVEQIAQLSRATSGRVAEKTYLLTSCTPEELNARTWLNLNRSHWSIENGLHQRLDVSRLDDLCRIRSSNGLWLHGMFSRFANSLFVQWQSGWSSSIQKHKTTTDFASFMSAEHYRKAMLTVICKKPNLKPFS